MTPRRAFIAWAFLLLATRAEGQSPFYTCLDRQGRPIPSITNNDMGWGGQAAFVGSQRVIVWNNDVMQHMSKASQLFIYLHECAHHNLGHVGQPENLQAEGEADCWAIQLMVDGGMVERRELDELWSERKTVPGDDNHLGGRALIDSYQRCLDIRTDRKAWAAALKAFTAAAPDSFRLIRGRPIADASTGINESIQDAPGTYDCEVHGAEAVRCLVFASRTPGASRKRYEQLVRMLRGWLPAGWTSVEQGGTAARTERLFMAQDSTTNTVIGLVNTSESRVYFVVRRVSGDATPTLLKDE